MNHYDEIDRNLKQSLQSLSKSQKNYWEFRYNSTRKQLHSCSHYPAMMVPQMQSQILNTIINTVPKTKGVYEPFVGSGTVMLESMNLGLDFTGHDINPLAILICKAKLSLFLDNELKSKIEELIAQIQTDKKFSIETNLLNVNKWFNDDIATELSKIRRSIRKENSLWARRFFWMTLAEVVRLSSNSRTSTYKLHIRPEKEILKRRMFPIKEFIKLLYENLEKFQEQKNILKDKSLLKNSKYIGKIRIELKDASTTFKPKKQFDLLVTSPPYGDNQTTVTYGQFSYLPLNWIDLHDIDEKIDNSYLKSINEIDKRSLGGLKRNAINDITHLLDKSKNLREIIEKIMKHSEEGASRVAAFWRDMNSCLKTFASVVKDNGYMVLITGNRNVTGHQIPMDKIVSELLSVYGVITIEKISRSIPIKRIALQNNISKTMNKENILIMRKTQYNSVKT
jgi:site-specific DNA-adenine methylase